MTQNKTQNETGAQKVCYLHIGPHKTGTTSIQNALFHNAERLASIGLRYPTLSGDRPGRKRRNHTPLARLNVLKADDLKTAPFWSELDEELRRTDGSIIVSTEHFADALRDEGRFRKVIGFFRDHGFRIVAVAYVRDQPGWLNSWYTQDQRNFVSRQSFAEFLDHALEIGLVDPWAFLRRFIDDEAIEVRVVSFEQAIKQGLAKSFLTAIGAPADFEIGEPQASNPNLGVKGMYAAQEIMRRVDVRVRSLPNYADLYAAFKQTMKGRDWEKTAYVGVSPEDEKRIRDHYRDSNDAFAREWFGSDWETICPPRPMTRREFDFDAAEPAEKAEVLEVVDHMVGMIKGAPAASKGPDGKAGKGKGAAKPGGKPAGKGPGAGKGPAAQGPGGKGAAAKGSGKGPAAASPGAGKPKKAEGQKAGGKKAEGKNAEGKKPEVKAADGKKASGDAAKTDGAAAKGGGKKLKKVATPVII